MNKETFDKILKISNQKCCFSDLKSQRKRRRERVLDLVKWYNKYGIVNKYYNKYGFDIKGLRDQKEYFETTVVADESERRPKEIYNPYNIVTYDKWLFSAYMESIDPSLVVKTYYVIKDGKVFIPSNTNKKLADILKEMENNSKLVFKIYDGLQGKGFFLVEKKNKEVIINKGEVSKKEFEEAVNSKKYIVQDYFVQSKEMSEICSSSVNTLRIVTTKFNDEVQVFSSVLRIGGSNSNVTDNFASGGILIGIDENGNMMKYGYRKKLPRVIKHPDSEFEFEGKKVPMFKEACNLCKKMHEYYPGHLSLGWDIAVGEDGLKIIEVNSNWDIPMMQIACGGLKERWEYVKNK